MLKTKSTIVHNGPQWFAMQSNISDKKIQPTPLFLPTVACGLFGISDDYIEKYQSLDMRFIKNKSSTFFFEARGDSMAPMIVNKDVLVVDRSIESMYGRVCVFSLDGGMFCKRILKRNNHLLLVSENQNYKPQVVNPEQEFCFFGVVTAASRDIR
jgi:DNA polymerase V